MALQHVFVLAWSSVRWGGNWLRTGVGSFAQAADAHALPRRRLTLASWRICSAAAWPASKLREQSTTCAPPAASARQVSRPSPVLPPVTRAVLPVRSAPWRASSAVVRYPNLLPRWRQEENMVRLQN